LKSYSLFFSKNHAERQEMVKKQKTNEMICFLPPDGVSCADGFIGKEIADASKGHA
jgi:hypothetical protein